MLINPEVWSAYESAQRVQAVAFANVEQAKRALAAAEHDRDIATCNVADLQARLLRDARAELGPIKRQPGKPTLDTARYTKSDVRE